MQDIEELSHRAPARVRRMTTSKPRLQGHGAIRQNAQNTLVLWLGCMVVAFSKSVAAVALMVNTPSMGFGSRSNDSSTLERGCLGVKPTSA